MKIRALIDGDIILWKAALAAQTNVNFGCDDHPDWVYDADEDAAAMLCRRMVASIKNRTEARQVLVCLSPTKTETRSHSHYWRHDILSSYKAHRPSKEPHPMLLHGFVRNFLETTYPCQSEVDLEADDLLGIHATDPTSNTEDIICSIDKDFKQIPGWFYNTMQGTIVETNEEDADREHFTQMLCGDTVDNYKGCPSIGPKKAEKLLAKADKEYNDACDEDRRVGLPSINYLRWCAVVEAFHKKQLTDDDALIQARVSRILRFDEYDFNTQQVNLWSPPDE